MYIYIYNLESFFVVSVLFSLVLFRTNSLLEQYLYICLVFSYPVYPLLRFYAADAINLF